MDKRKALSHNARTSNHRTRVLEVSQFKMNVKKLINVVHSEWTGIKSLARIQDLFAYNELFNVATILELALWKFKMDECVPLAQEPLNVGNRATEIRLGPREECRIRCGADVVIRNVLPFLWNYEREWPTIIF